jgi:hypothetical protein
MANTTSTTVANITSVIRTVRGYKVLLDDDLAKVYGVETGALNQAVRRNRKRFPADFVFQLTKEEHEDLRCQIGISNSRGGARKQVRICAGRFLPAAGQSLRALERPRTLGDSCRRFSLRKSEMNPNEIFQSVAISSVRRGGWLRSSGPDCRRFYIFPADRLS